tara:strand:+ start:194 stop:1021 length:828 start_codon:yes stop_codon:yes gene_type:complete
MFSYYFDTNEYAEILQYISLFLLFVIGIMIYYMSTNSENLGKDLKEQINNLDLECPECPDHPGCPACPKCPDLKCNEGMCPECPACPATEGEGGDGNKECPACPTVPSVSCPTVDDIVTGIFPGRNPGITSGGKYFDIMANDSYELLPSYDFYNPVDAFPSDSILSAPDSLMRGNVDVPTTEIDNSVDGSLVDTNIDTSLSRMDMASMGENTGPSTFGSGTERVESGLSNVERQRRAAIADGGDADASVAAQEERDANERDMRSDLQGQTGTDDP